MKKLTGLAVGVLALLVGCTSVVPRGDDVRLEGTSWALTGIVEGGRTTPLAGGPVTLRFTADSVAGKACNNFVGSFTQNQGVIAIGDLASTMMYCDEAGVMEQEAAVLEILPTLTSASMDEGTLLLTAPDGRGLTAAVQA